jgi:NADH-quinone oxidoreductase subunit L
MENILSYFLLVPLFGYIISLLIHRKQEALLSYTAVITAGVQFAGAVAFIAIWMLHGHPIYNHKDLVLFSSHNYEFYLDFAFDKITAMYLLVGSFLTFLVTVYSRFYLHRESGYKRFFNTVLFFFFGYNLVILSGNLETLFIGWEILGISSFLLIAFYRDRYLPVKNAVKVFSIYRIGDVGLLIAMWMTHHLFHQNVTFITLNNYEIVHEHLQTHSWIGIIISMMFFISAAAKSAQLPFSSWLPRAMEGPTPSSAIFYGSLSVHIGIFLMLRTFPFWEHQLSVRILIGVMGLFTAVVATLISRVQSSVKSQIAYSSIAQIGLIFIEVSLGWKDIALWHFAGNAFLRTYQLLVSPSVVSYLIKEQFFNFVPRPHTIEDSLPKRLEYSLYMLSLKEFNLDSFMYRYLWNPLKGAGKALNFLTVTRAFFIFLPLYVFGILLLNFESMVPPMVHDWLPTFFSLIGLISVLKAFTEREKARLSWLMVMMNHFWIALAISFSEHYSFTEAAWYLGGIIVAGVGGFWALYRLRKLEDGIDLARFHGHAHLHPKIGFVFLLCCLGLTGFPISPTFIGEDLIFSHIHADQFWLAAFTAVSLIIDGLAIIRIYARVFLGPHAKSVYEMAYKNG